MPSGHEVERLPFPLGQTAILPRANARLRKQIFPNVLFHSSEMKVFHSLLQADVAAPAKISPDGLLLPGLFMIIKDHTSRHARIFVDSVSPKPLLDPQ
jgi:hypothetical protein